MKQALPDNYKCNLSALSPRTFNIYVLPVDDVPVYHLGKELCRVPVPASGEIELPIPGDLCRRLHSGVLRLDPVTEVVSKHALHGLLIVGFLIVESA